MPSPTPQQTLKDVFGFDDFRGGQQAVVSRVLKGHSTAAIFATGAGSHCVISCLRCIYPI